MTQQSSPLEPTNIERAQWAKNALAVFTAETFSGEEPGTMNPQDLADAIGDLICDLLHLANYHPRMDALIIHSHARDMFELELAEEQALKAATEGCVSGVTTAKSDEKAPASPLPDWLDALLDIKRLAEKSDDRGYDPFTLLDLIAERAPLPPFPTHRNRRFPHDTVPQHHHPCRLHAISAEPAIGECRFHSH